MNPLFAQEDATADTLQVVYSSMTSIMDEIKRETPWLTEVTFAGNQLWQWLALLMAVVTTMSLGRLVRFALLRAATQAETRAQTVLATILTSSAKSVALASFALGLSIGIKLLNLPEEIANKIIGIALVCAVGNIAYKLVVVIDFWMRSFSSRTASRLDDMLAPLVTKIVRSLVVTLVLVQIVQIVSGMTPTSIVAGLGVGGLAIGLAAQDTIKNIFGSIMIFSDRPFELGDEIIVDGNAGTVESVGFRSTRYRTGTGHVITIPNGDLASKAIINVSRRRNLSRTIVLPLPPTLTSQRMEQAIDIVKDVLADHEGMLPSMPPKVVFNDITPTALNLQAQYWYHPPDGNRFNALNQRVNLEILRRFQAAEITLAVPLQRVELDKAA